MLAGSCARIASTEPEGFLELLHGRLILPMSLRRSRERAKFQPPQCPANCCLVQADAELLENPRGQILQPPANHAMDGRDGPILDDAGQRLTLLHIQLGGVPGSFPAAQSIWTTRIEPQHPVADNLRANPADPRRSGPGTPS